MSGDAASSPNRLVVLGGTFNPVHYGHLSVASQIAWHLSAPVHLVLSARPPHRAGVASARQRWEMLKLATSGHPQLIADRRELDRSGPSYMVDTLREFKAQYPGSGLVLALGSDAAGALDGWHCAEELAKLAHLLIIQRPGSARRLNLQMLNQLGFTTTSEPADLDHAAGGSCYVMPSVALEISASAIRHLVAEGGPIDYMTPADVVDYVQIEALYVR